LSLTKMLSTRRRWYKQYFSFQNRFHRLRRRRKSPRQLKLCRKSNNNNLISRKEYTYASRCLRVMNAHVLVERMNADWASRLFSSTTFAVLLNMAALAYNQYSKAGKPGRAY
jgi:hypothetical protein